VGVTATPYAAMAGDPVCTPDHMLILKSDKPFNDAEYFGYDVLTQRIQGVKVQSYNLTLETDGLGLQIAVLNLIEKILQRPRNRVRNGIEIPLILITAEFENAPQDQLNDLVMSAFDDQVYSRTFHQGTTYEFNCKTLNEFFDPANLTQKICTTGAMILIGSKRLDTGITVKPGLAVNLKKNYGNICYEVFGVTDQIIELSKEPVESTNMQLMRLFGYYPKGHTSNLWVPFYEHLASKTKKDYIRLFETDLIQIDNQFRYKFDPSIRAKSVAKISIPNPIIKSIWGKDDAYSGNGTKFGHKINDFNNESEIRKEYNSSTLIELKTHLHYPTISSGLVTEIANHPQVQTRMIANSHLVPTLMDLHALTTLQSRLRNECLTPNGSTLTTSDVTIHKKIWTPYDLGRYQEILKAIVSPKLNNTNWQVNGFIWGNKGLETPINEIWIVMFEKKWNDITRERLDAHPTSIFWFNIGGQNGYLTIQNCKQLEHRYLDNYEDLKNNGFNINHDQSCGEDIDNLATKFKLTDPNGWGVFRSICKRHNANGGSSFCAPYYQKLKLNSIYGQYIELLKMENKEQMVMRGISLLSGVNGLLPPIH
jgi:hypothetical protein